MRTLIRYVILVLVPAVLLACASSPTATPKAASTTAPPTTKPAQSSTAPSTTSAPKVTVTSAPATVSFTGKTITLVVPTAPGSSTDIVSRLYARFLPKYLPGRPSMVVRNMPGGAYTIGGNYVHNSKPDGLTILSSTSGLYMAQLLGVGAVRFDLLKMTTLLGTSSGGVYFTKAGIVAKPEDLLKAKGLIFGYSAGTSVGNAVFIIAKEAMGIPTDKIVLAYSSAGEAFRAFVSGESNFGYMTGASYQESVAPYVQKGEVIPLFQSGTFNEKGEVVRDPNLPPMPTLSELYEKVLGKPLSGGPMDAYKAVVAAGYSYNQSLHLPPGIPDSVVRAYWDASAAMLKDPEFLSIMDRLIGQGAAWRSGEAYDKAFKVNFAMKPEVRDWMVTAMKKYGIVIE